MKYYNITQFLHGMKKLKKNPQINQKSLTLIKQGSFDTIAYSDHEMILFRVYNTERAIW